jgi:hypothetical protein
MKRLICICVAVILLTAAPVVAITGNELRESADLVEKYPGTGSEGLFMGYVLGVHETLPIFCIPAGVTNRQITEVVSKYLKDHPEELDLSASALVIDAIQTAWPCDEKKELKP